MISTRKEVYSVSLKKCSELICSIRTPTDREDIESIRASDREDTRERWEEIAKCEVSCSAEEDEDSM